MFFFEKHLEWFYGYKTPYAAGSGNCALRTHFLGQSADNLQQMLETKHFTY
jgi:hypothetical protein